jgi:branched-chain amino acid transport system substrate-binding protein
MRRGVARCGLAVLAVACLLASGCGDDESSGSSGDATASSSGPVKIGILTEASGPFNPVFAGFADGAEAYFKEVNDAGGIGGRTIETTIYDTKSDPTQTIQAAKRAVTDEVFAAVVGTGHNTTDVLDTAKIPTTGWGVTPAWADKDYVFPYSGPKSSNTTDAFIRFFTDQGIKKIAILSSSDSGSGPVGEQWVTMAEKLGVEIAFRDLAVPSSGGDKAAIGADVQRIKESGAEGVVSAMGDNSGLIAGLAQAGVKAQVLLATGFNDDFAKAMGEAMVGVHVSTDTTPRQATDVKGVADYLAAMEKYAPGKPVNELSQIGYISARLLADGMRGAGDDLTREKVKDVLSSYSGDMDGLAQPIKFPDFQHGPAPCLAVMEWTGTEWRQVGQKPFICSESSS